MSVPRNYAIRELTAEQAANVESRKHAGERACCAATRCWNPVTHCCQYDYATKSGARTRYLFYCKRHALQFADTYHLIAPGEQPAPALDFGGETQ